MINQSKKNDSRFLSIWRASGAVETIDDAVMRFLVKTANDLAKDNKLIITATGENRAEGYTTLSLGERVVNSGPGWIMAEPILYVIAPGHNYRPGMTLTKLPSGSKPLSSYCT